MQLGRTVRTVRYLSLEQWLYRGICRGRWAVAERLPHGFGRRVERVAARLPPPDVERGAVMRVAQHVLMLQRAVHGDDLGGIPEGRFRLMGRSVDFGAPDAIDWRRDLGEGNNRLWRMTLAYLGWAVPLLATGNPDLFALVVRALASLERQNPWSAEGVFRDVWHPYTASHRLINLLAGLSLYRGAAGPPTDEDDAFLRHHIRRCAAFVLDNLERDLQYNHLLKNIVALAAFGASLDAACGSLSFLAAAMQRSVEQQVLSDGGHAERSPMYHALCLLDLRILRDSGQFPDEARLLDDRIAAMERALGILSHPDGDIALFNDAWLGEAPRAADLARPAADGVSALPETGYVRLASGADAVIFDCGPIGPDDNPGHAHADFLAVEATVGGARLVVDPGVPTYSAGALRDECRSADGHNGPHVKGAEPIEFWSSFRVGRRGRAWRLDAPGLAGRAPLWCAGWQDGYRRNGFAVARWIGFWPGQGFLIVDAWRGAPVERCGLRFLVPNSWQAETGPAFYRDGNRIAVTLLGGKHLALERARSWPRFGEEETAYGLAIAPDALGRGAFAASAWEWGERLPLSRGDAAKIAEALLEASG